VIGPEFKPQYSLLCPSPQKKRKVAEKIIFYHQEKWI
jgi:hypothetical protein